MHLNLRLEARVINLSGTVGYERRHDEHAAALAKGAAYVRNNTKVTTTMKINDGGNDGGGRGRRWRWRAVALAAAATAKCYKLKIKTGSGFFCFPGSS